MTHQKRIRIFGLTFSFVTLLIFFVALFRLAEETAVRNWLRRSAVALASLTPDSPSHDLQLLKTPFQTARIVGLGEATHGTREFFLIKHRLIRFLVEDLNYTVVALEASYAACAVVNDYVLHGIGSADDAVASLGLWMWQTEEMKALIEWMRLHNMHAAAHQQVRFVGFDMQTHESSYPKLFEFFKRVAPHRLPALIAWLQEFRTIEIDFRTTRTTSHHTLLEHLTHAISNDLAYLHQHYDELKQTISNEAYLDAVMRLQTMQQFLQLVRAMLTAQDNAMSAGVAIRDSSMAVNFQTIAEALYPTSKIVCWAHNGHIANGDINDIPSMGHRLKFLYGEKYYAVGFDFKQGEFQARNKANHNHIEPCALTSPEYSTSLPFSTSLMPFENFFVDFRHSQGDFFVQHWLKQPHFIHQIGAIFSHNEPIDTWLKPVTFGTTFDGFVYVSYTSPSRLLAAR